MQTEVKTDDLVFKKGDSVRLKNSIHFYQVMTVYSFSAHNFKDEIWAVLIRKGSDNLAHWPVGVLEKV